MSDRYDRRKFLTSTAQACNINVFVSPWDVAQKYFSLDFYPQSNILDVAHKRNSGFLTMWRFIRRYHVNHLQIASTELLKAGFNRTPSTHREAD